MSNSVFSGLEANSNPSGNGLEWGEDRCILMEAACSLAAPLLAVEYAAARREDEDLRQLTGRQGEDPSELRINMGSPLDLAIRAAKELMMRVDSL